MKKIIYLCNYSTSEIRSNLSLRNYYIANIIRKFCNKNIITYTNSAIWYSDYIEEFKKHTDKYEFHVVSSHQGMRKRFQDVVDGDIHIHYFKNDNCYLVNLIKALLNWDLKHDYKTNRKRFVTICNRIHPDLILLCGAENTYYSYGVLDVDNVPEMVILQTLLNDPKRIEMGVGSAYRRQKEMEIFQHAKYFVTTMEQASAYIHSVNKQAEVFPIKFVSHQPEIYPAVQKEYNFAFFAGHITVNKGLTDVIKALRLVVDTHPNANLNIIGGFSAETYRQEIITLIKTLKLQKNIHIAGSYPDVNDAYRAVQQAQAVVIPGITALNSTIRESMLMGLPTIIYDIPGRKEMIPDDCVLAVPVEDVDALAMTMLFAIENPEEIELLGKKGKHFADQTFSNSSIGEQLVEAFDKILKQ